MGTRAALARQNKLRHLVSPGRSCGSARDRTCDRGIMSRRTSVHRVLPQNALSRPATHRGNAAPRPRRAPEDVSEILGHSTISITLDLYSHVTPSMQEQAAQSLDSLFGCQLGCQTRTP